MCIALEAVHLKLHECTPLASHCKKLEVDLTQENVISVALWVHLGPGSGPPPVAMVKGYTLSQSRILAKHELGNSFCNWIFCQKGGGTLPIFIYYWMNSENIHAR